MLEEKFVVVLDETLSLGVAFNALAHLALSIGNHATNILGKEKIIDASGVIHQGLSKYPFIILKASSSRIREIVRIAKKNDALLIIDFPEQAYTEYTDEELVEALSKIREENLKYYGVALFGKVKEIDKLTKDLKLWK